MRAIFEKSRLSGMVKAPPSKSAAHRLLIAASLAEGESVIAGVEYSEDISATLDCAEALGAEIERCGSTVKIDGTRFLSEVKGVLDCRESGSTLRFFIPLAMLTGETVTFTGSERLLARPLDVYERIAAENSITFVKKGGCITVLGKLPKKKFAVDGSISSQFVTGLMFALARLGGGEIHVLPPFESRPYAEMTAAALGLFGADIKFRGNDITLTEGQRLRPWSGEVEGDFSNAEHIQIRSVYDEQLHDFPCSLIIVFAFHRRSSRILIVTSAVPVYIPYRSRYRARTASASRASGRSDVGVSHSIGRLR